MSLISLRNLAGPFRSKLQMGALVIVVLLVLAIRLGSSRPGGSDLDGQPSPLDASSRPTGDLLNVLREAKQPNQRVPSKTNDDLLDELVAEGIRQPPARNDNQGRNSESFEDIRKSLGLE